jgi:hypothetical protein
LRNGLVHLRHSVAEPEQLASRLARAGRLARGGTRRAPGGSNLIYQTDSPFSEFFI